MLSQQQSVKRTAPHPDRQQSNVNDAYPRQSFEPLQMVHGIKVARVVSSLSAFQNKTYVDNNQLRNNGQHYNITEPLADKGVIEHISIKNTLVSSPTLINISCSKSKEKNKAFDGLSRQQCLNSEKDLASKAANITSRPSLHKLVRFPAKGINLTSSRQSSLDRASNRSNSSLKKPASIDNQQDQNQQRPPSGKSEDRLTSLNCNEQENLKSNPENKGTPITVFRINSILSKAQQNLNHCNRNIDRTHRSDSNSHLSLAQCESQSRSTDYVLDQLKRLSKNYQLKYKEQLSQQAVYYGIEIHRLSLIIEENQAAISELQRSLSQVRQKCERKERSISRLSIKLISIDNYKDQCEEYTLKRLEDVELSFKMLVRQYETKCNLAALQNKIGHMQILHASILEDKLVGPYCFKETVANQLNTYDVLLRQLSGRLSKLQESAFASKISELRLNCMQIELKQMRHLLDGLSINFDRFEIQGVQVHVIKQIGSEQSLNESKLSRLNTKLSELGRQITELHESKQALSQLNQQIKLQFQETLNKSTQRRNSQKILEQKYLVLQQEHRVLGDKCKLADEEIIANQQRYRVRQERHRLEEQKAKDSIWELSNAMSGLERKAEKSQKIFDEQRLYLKQLENQLIEKQIRRKISKSGDNDQLQCIDNFFEKGHLNRVGQLEQTIQLKQNLFCQQQGNIRQGLQIIQEKQQLIKRQVVIIQELQLQARKSEQSERQKQRTLAQQQGQIKTLIQSNSSLKRGYSDISQQFKLAISQREQAITQKEQLLQFQASQASECQYFELSNANSQLTRQCRELASKNQQLQQSISDYVLIFEQQSQTFKSAIQKYRVDNGCLKDQNLLLREENRLIKNPYTTLLEQQNPKNGSPKQKLNAKSFDNWPDLNIEKSKANFIENIQKKSASSANTSQTQRCRIDCQDASSHDISTYRYNKTRNSSSSLQLRYQEHESKHNSTYHIDKLSSYNGHQSEFINKLLQLKKAIQYCGYICPLKCSIDSTGYLKHEEFGTYLVDQNENLFQLSAQQIDIAISNRFIDMDL